MPVGIPTEASRTFVGIPTETPHPTGRRISSEAERPCPTEPGDRMVGAAGADVAIGRFPVRERRPLQRSCRCCPDLSVVPGPGAPRAPERTVGLPASPRAWTRRHLSIRPAMLATDLSNGVIAVPLEAYPHRRAACAA